MNIEFWRHPSRHLALHYMEYVIYEPALSCDDISVIEFLYMGCVMQKGP